jgi:ABC-type multidrug transport system fused ATPase/permease subunit
LVLALATLLATGAALLEPWPLQIVVDHVLGGQPLAGVPGRGAALLPGTDTPPGILIWAVLGGLVIFSVRSALNVVLTLGTILVGQRMVLELAHDLFAAIQRRSLLFHTRQPVGDSLARVNEDSWCLHTVAQDLFLEPTRVLISGGGMLAVMARVDPSLTMLSVVVVPFMAISSVVAGRRLRGLARLRQDTEAHLKEHVHQTLSGVAVVQGFAQEDRQRWRFQDYAAEAVRANRRSALAAAMSTLGANGSVRWAWPRSCGWADATSSKAS